MGNLGTRTKVVVEPWVKATLPLPPQEETCRVLLTPGKVGEAEGKKWEAQLTCIIKKAGMSLYGLIPHLTASIHQNARRVLRQTPPGYCINSPSNLAFQRLTSHKSLPRATWTVLALSNKFVPTLASTTTKIIGHGIV